MYTYINIYTYLCYRHLGLQQGHAQEPAPRGQQPREEEGPGVELLGWLGEVWGLGMGWVGMDWIGLDGCLDAWMDGWMGWSGHAVIGIGLGV